MPNAYRYYYAECRRLAKTQSSLYLSRSNVTDVTSIYCRTVLLHLNVFIGIELILHVLQPKMPAALVLKIDNFKPYSACEYCLPILNAPPVEVECSMFIQDEYMYNNLLFTSQFLQFVVLVMTQSFIPFASCIV